jgi:RNA processing factor Prp31
MNAKSYYYLLNRIYNIISFNTFLRFREWYSYHFPELVKIITDNYLYAKVVQFIGNRKEFTEDSLEQLEELVMDSGKAQAILEASRSSMGEQLPCLFKCHAIYRKKYMCALLVS